MRVLWTHNYNPEPRVRRTRHSETLPFAFFMPIATTALLNASRRSSAPFQRP